MEFFNQDTIEMGFRVVCGTPQKHCVVLSCMSVGYKISWNSGLLLHQRSKMWGFLLSLPIELHTLIIFQCSFRPELWDSLEMLSAFRLPQILPSSLLILPLRTWVISTTVFCKETIRFLHILDPILSFGLKDYWKHLICFILHPEK